MTNCGQHYVTSPSGFNGRYEQVYKTGNGDLVDSQGRPVVIVK